MELSEQELIRRQSLEEIIKLGINPYPAELYEVNASAKEIAENYGREKLSYKNISLAGRIMSRRIMGNASFVELQDSTGRIQVYVKRDDICPDEDKTLYNIVFKKHLDIGDIIGVKGYVFTTQTGEITVHVTELNILCKSLRPLPVVKTDAEGKMHDAFSDPEQRYRQRYVDLIVNPHVREAFIKRTQLTNSMRSFLNNKGYLEVETPVLQPIYGGAA
ncbi:MAG: lysine--tRNA ligase, partial [Bacteroidetes bacterium]|nr:lysine--tRNA ligase [Bacteroidota bacterium]